MPGFGIDTGSSSGGSGGTVDDDDDPADYYDDDPADSGSSSGGSSGGTSSSPSDDDPAADSPNHNTGPVATPESDHGSDADIPEEDTTTVDPTPTDPTAPDGVDEEVSGGGYVPGAPADPDTGDDPSGDDLDPSPWGDTPWWQDSEGDANLVAIGDHLLGSVDESVGRQFDDSPGGGFADPDTWVGGDTPGGGDPAGLIGAPSWLPETDVGADPRNWDWDGDGEDGGNISDRDFSDADPRNWDWDGDGDPGGDLVDRAPDVPTLPDLPDLPDVPTPPGVDDGGSLGRVLVGAGVVGAAAYLARERGWVDV